MNPADPRALPAGFPAALPAAALADPTCQLRFESLFHEGRALAFPCDDRGEVALDALSERARRNYFYARAVVGREYAQPRVIRPLSA